MSATNRVWDVQAGPGFVTWKTQVPDNLGIEYPGPGTFGVDTSDYCATRDTRVPSQPEAELPGLSRSPAGLWLFDGDLTAQAGNDLSVAGGSVIYGPGPAQGSKAVYLNGSTWLNQAHDPNLQITGDITVMLTVKPTVVASADGYVIAFSGNGETEATNILWTINIVAQNQIRWVHENAGGVNNIFIWSNGTVSPDRWTHVALVRDATANTVRAFVDGYPLSTVYNYANDATGGGSAFVHFGAFSDGVQAFWTGWLSGAKVVPAVLTDAQVLEQARAALPAGYRP